ncbi:MAG: GTPase Era [Campylobacterales bacterium]|nr:GTPase Era [Campylobacterales bacterium]
MIDTKCGFIAVVGRPNAGKSSLLNFLVNERLALVSHKQNATRKRQNIIVMHKENQLIFVDTPGIHEREKLLNQFMLEEVMKSLGDCDIVVFLAPITDDLSHYEKFLELNRDNKPHIVLLTKVDFVKNEDVLEKLHEYSKYSDKFLEIIPFTIKKDNQKVRDNLFETISKYLPKSPFLYDPEFLTTSNIREIYKELIRESIFENLSDELPYESDVIIDKIFEDDRLDKVYATIVVERDNQKGMMIGKNGETIKRVGKHARESMEDFAHKKIYLDLKVVIKQGWTKTKKSLGELGYSMD